jgi:quinol monooxygenase YgiN
MSQTHVQMRIWWDVRPEQANAVTAAVQRVMTAPRREAGCLTCSLVTEMTDRVSLTLAEEWDSEGTLRRHVRSARFGTVAGLMESALAPPRIEFALPGGTRGLD